MHPQEIPIVSSKNEGLKKELVPRKYNSFQDLIKKPSIELPSQEENFDSTNYPNFQFSPQYPLNHPQNAHLPSKQRQQQLPEPNAARAASLKPPNQQLIFQEVDRTPIKRSPSKLFNLLTSLRLKKLLQDFLNSLESRRYNFLKMKQHGLIQDKSSSFMPEPQHLKGKTNHSVFSAGASKEAIQSSSKKRSNCYCAKLVVNYLLGLLCRFMGNILSYIPIFYPQSKLKFLWDILQLIAIMVFFFHIPLCISFNQSIGYFSSSVLLIICYVIIVLDIFVNFNTGYFFKDEFVKSRLKIAKNYARGKLFFFDLISVLSLSIIIFGYPSTFRFTTILFLFKLFGFIKTFCKLEEGIRINHLAVHILQILKLLFLVLLISHIFSCVWIQIGLISHSDQTWISKRSLENSSWSQVYLVSFYFVTLTMLTVGYGDVVPTNELETIICILLMVVSCVLFAYMLNSLGQIFREINRESDEIKRDQHILNTYLETNNIPLALRFQVREYLDYYWRQNNQNKIEVEKRILSQLSVNLRQNLLIEANKIILKDSPIFNKNFSKKVLTKALSVIQEVHFTPEQDIFVQHTLDHNDIFFIEKGKVELYVNLSRHTSIFGKKKPKQRQLVVLEEGASFGSQSFFTGFSRSHSARSLDFTKLRLIRRKEFISILQEFPAEYETFCKIKDLISLSNDMTKIGQLCFCCENSTKHSFAACPYIHYNNNHFKTVKQLNLPTPNRSAFLRNPHSKFSALLNHHTTQEDIIKFHNRFLQEDSFPDFRKGRNLFGPSGERLNQKPRKRRRHSSSSSFSTSSSESSSSGSSSSSPKSLKSPNLSQVSSQMICSSYFSECPSQRDLVTTNTRTRELRKKSPLSKQSTNHLPHKHSNNDLQSHRTSSQINQTSECYQKKQLSKKEHANSKKIVSHHQISNTKNAIERKNYHSFESSDIEQQIKPIDESNHNNNKNLLRINKSNIPIPFYFKQANLQTLGNSSSSSVPKTEEPESKPPTMFNLFEQHSNQDNFKEQFHPPNKSKQQSNTPSIKQAGAQKPCSAVLSYSQKQGLAIPNSTSTIKSNQNTFHFKQNQVSPQILNNQFNLQAITQNSRHSNPFRLMKQQRDEVQIIDHLDKMQAYVNYFPKDNFELKIAKANRINMKQRKHFIRKRQKKRLGIKSMNLSQDIFLPQQFMNLIQLNEQDIRHRRHNHLKRKDILRKGMAQSHFHLDNRLELSPNQPKKIQQLEEESQLSSTVAQNRTPFFKVQKQNIENQSQQALPGQNLQTLGLLNSITVNNSETLSASQNPNYNKLHVNHHNYEEDIIRKKAESNLD